MVGEVKSRKKNTITVQSLQTAKILKFETSNEYITLFGFHTSNSDSKSDFLESHKAEIVKAPLLQEEDRETKVLARRFHIVPMEKNGNCLFAAIGWGNRLQTMIEVPFLLVLHPFSH